MNQPGTLFWLSTGKSMELSKSEAFKEQNQTSKRELFAKILIVLMPWSTFLKSLILDVSRSSEYVCVHCNYLYVVLTLYFISGMVQPELWCSPATSAEKNNSRWVSPLKKVIFLPNFVILWSTDMSDFIRGYLKFLR